jgi:alginate O-acetyltransferase complex protein AlgI
LLFNTAQYWLFFTAIVLAYYTLPVRFQQPLLLVASYWFYMAWDPRHGILLAGCSLVAWACGVLMENCDRDPSGARTGRRRLIFTLGMVALFGVLFSYKYTGFFLDSLRDGLAWLGIRGEIPKVSPFLPVGISFFTFQSASYVIDVFTRSTPAVRSPFQVMLFVSFFPQLVAGPIERPDALVPQLSKPHFFDFSRVPQGLAICLWGLTKKVLIADMVAPVVETVYSAPHNFPAQILILATVFFAIQIYCDFSGYSDIATGSAHILGIELMTNFRRPYMARSIAEFWQRWHISLSTWFRDYVYIPLGGNRVPVLRWVFNIYTVFILSGLWHGAAWTFIAWGALHGTYMLGQRWLEALTPEALRKAFAAVVPAWLRGAAAVATVFVLACAGWVFFRAGSMADALAVFTGLAKWSGFSVGQIWSLGLPRFEMMLALGAIALLLAVEALIEHLPEWCRRVWSFTPARWSLAIAQGYALLCFGVFREVEFIYFQF